MDDSWRYASISSKFDDLAFNDVALNSAFGNPDRQIRVGSRSCLLKFASPGDGDPVTFYVTTIDPVRTEFVIKRGDGEVKTNYHLDSVDNLSLGDQPICGYSVVTEEEASSGRQIGDTIVYFIVKDTSDENLVLESRLIIPTNSEEAMEAYFAEGNEAESSFSPSSIFNLVDLADQNPDPTSTDNGLNGRAAATVWLGDNRSLVLPSYSNDMIQFDANTEEFSFLEEPSSPRADSDGILFACRAKQQDKVNMGCA